MNDETMIHFRQRPLLSGDKQDNGTTGWRTLGCCGEGALGCCGREEELFRAGFPGTDHRALGNEAGGLGGLAGRQWGQQAREGLREARGGGLGTVSILTMRDLGGDTLGDHLRAMTPPGKCAQNPQALLAALGGQLGAQKRPSGSPTRALQCRAERAE